MRALACARELIALAACAASAAVPRSARAQAPSTAPTATPSATPAAGSPGPAAGSAAPSGGTTPPSGSTPPSAAAPPSAAGPPSTAPSEPAARRTDTFASTKPPPLHVDYLQYGAALTAEILLTPGAICPPEPCIIGGGGGLTIRAGYRSPGPWYFGGAYEFARVDSQNLLRLGILQQARFEIRYLTDIGYRANPYASLGFGGLIYGNEWGAETAGAVAYLGPGVEIEVSRLAIVGASLVYRPMLFVGWTDTADYVRSTGLAHFLGFELQLEIRSELTRR